MIRYYIMIFLITTFGCQKAEQSKDIDGIVKDFYSENSLDQRTTYLDVSIDDGALVGKAQNQELVNQFGKFISMKKAKEFDNQLEVISTVPAYIRNSVSNARSMPKHSAELSTQYLMGQKVNIIDTAESGNWYFIQGPDNYLAWIDEGGILPQEKVSKAWLNADKVIVVENEISARDKDDQSIVTDLVFGNQLGKTPNGLITPAGDHVKVPANSYSTVSLADAGNKIERVIEKAFSLMGRPYLWGGTSTKAMDCSGFTRTAFMNAGYLLGRDASLQVHEGKEIDKNDISQWKKGDLLFFGNLREDGSQRITHVAIHLANGDMIHESERVRVESVNPDSDLYNEERANSLMRVKRILE